MADRPSEAQRKLLLSLMEENRDLGSKKKDNETNEQRLRKWGEVAEQINPIGPFVRDAKGWREYWKQWKQRVKMQHAELKRKRSCTGGRRRKIKNLSDINQGVLKFIGEDSFHGVVAPRSDPQLPPSSDPQLHDRCFTPGSDKEYTVIMPVEIQFGSSADVPVSTPSMPPITDQNQGSNKEYTDIDIDIEYENSADESVMISSMPPYMCTDCSSASSETETHNAMPLEENSNKSASRVGKQPKPKKRLRQMGFLQELAVDMHHTQAEMAKDVKGIHEQLTIMANEMKSQTKIFENIAKQFLSFQHHS